MNNYLEALTSKRSPRSSRRNPEKMQSRREEIAEEIKTAGPAKKLALVQERIDIDQALEDSQVEEVNIEELEETFVEVANAYSQRKGISYAAWREVGVPAEVLQRAGIKRTG